jgi:transposase
MLTGDLRLTVLTMKRRGMGIRAIARAVKVSRNTVRDILRHLQPPAPSAPRPPGVVEENPRLELIIRLLFKECEGSALRVAERLKAEHQIDLGYSTLTRYLRDLRLRQLRRGGKVHPEIITGPGVEAQLDTSPIPVKLGVMIVLLYLANLICGFSRHRYAQFFPRWRRFHVKVFLVRGFRCLRGTCQHVSIDNGREIVALGAGKNGVIASEMEHFADQLGFKFVAVEAGHKDRQGKVEAAHGFVQKNFLKGRRFRDLADLNAQLAQWCRDLFHRPVRGQPFAPADRWEEEQAHMQPLPGHIPEPSLTWRRRVDDRGRVWLHGSSYRVPDRFVLQWLTLQETGDEVTVLHGRDEVCRHARVSECERRTVPLDGYPEVRTRRAPVRQPSAEEVHLRTLGPEVSQYLDALEARPVRYSYARLRRLYRMGCEYPVEIFRPTVAEALVRRAFDLNLLERVLEQKMGHRIQTASLTPDPELEARLAYRKGQVTPHRLQPDPLASSADRRDDDPDTAASLSEGEEDDRT